MTKSLSVQSLLNWKVRVILYLFSFSTLIFIQKYSTSTCSYIDSLTDNSLYENLFILSLLHIIIRELLYSFIQKPVLKVQTLPRHAYILSIISWIIIGLVAFLLHYLRYPDFPISSHLKFLSGYWILGAALITQIEYTIFEIQYKRKSKNVDYLEFDEKISKRVTESFFILTLAPAIIYFLILTRYQQDGGLSSEHMINDLTYIIALCVAVALVSAKTFGDSLREDTKLIIDSIAEINKKNYLVDININRADELGEISTAIQKMGIKIHSSINEVQRKNEQIELLFRKFINLITSAIDGKNIVTGYHCRRVPELTTMLALAAHKSNRGIFKEFRITSEQMKQEIDFAALLHDCGKVIVPDHILDKGTKLDALYNRIHEIRTRFEVIYRDLIIQAQEKLSGMEYQDVNKWLKEEQKILFDEFALVAKINASSDKVSNEELQKIQQISKREWIRYFDDTIGLSAAEKERVSVEKQSIPTVEKLLSNKKSHIIKRNKEEKDKYKGLNFKHEAPENHYNLGELYNLTINSGGNLTLEDRYIINEHVMMTIKMLENLPFPEHLKNVPLFAGAHHEKLNGKGYPRGLKNEEIPLPAKMLALADIFEALTASDRPYKKAKTLSEAIKILSFMVKDGEIDKDVFELFLENKLYLEFANLHNFPTEQIDNVDLKEYLVKK